jgi:AcrR family transcriptional regulator
MQATVPEATIDVAPDAILEVHEPRGAATVRRVLKVVEEILDEGGEPSLRLADVSRRANVSIGSLYHHFESREGLIRAARQDQFLQSLPYDAERVTALLGSATTPAEFAEGLTEILRETQSPRRAPNRLRRVELIGAAVSRPELLEAISAQQTAITDIAETMAMEFQRRGLLREGVDPRTLSLFIQATTLGRVLGDLDQHGVDEDLWADHLGRALRAMMLVDEPDASAT